MALMERSGVLNGATLRVFGGVLIGIGISPVVLAAFTIPVDLAFGDVAVELFRPVVHLFAVVFGLVALHLVRLFHDGDWKSPGDRRA